MEDHPILMATGIAFPFLWIGGWIAASVVWRRRRGKPIFPRRPADAVYWEGWASGRRCDHWLALIANANGCLQVAVTRERLLVRPCFPFNLLFLPEVLGLEYDLPIGKVRSISDRHILFTRWLRLELDVPGKGDQTVELKLNDPAGFVRATGRQVR